MAKKIVVFSDIHADIPVGWKQKVETLVRPHWQGADMVIFNPSFFLGAVSHCKSTIVFSKALQSR